MILISKLLTVIIGFVLGATATLALEGHATPGIYLVAFIIITLAMVIKSLIKFNT